MFGNISFPNMNLKRMQVLQGFSLKNLTTCGRQRSCRKLKEFPNRSNEIVMEETKKNSMPCASELNQKIRNFGTNYYLIDVRRDKEAFYALSEDEIVKNYYCACGIALNLIMDGELEKTDEFLDSLPKNDIFDFIKLTLSIVHPKTTWKDFVNIIKYLEENNFHLTQVALTAGRPSVANGFNDFTRLWPFMEKKKDAFIKALSYLYNESLCPAIYNLCLAEYYYQQDKLFDAELLLNTTIKEFDKPRQQRLLFAALYLQSKILMANGNVANSQSYIKNIRKFIKKEGELEFSCNIDAAEVMFALYEGRHSDVSRWLKTNAPDEFADFNMLDLYRYMVKMRCYIFMGTYSAVIALAERLRPLLEAGRRYMDLCELDILLAVTFYKAKKMDLAFETLERVLKTVKRRKYYRMIIDEGKIIIDLLFDYIQKYGKTPFLEKIIKRTRSMKINYPLYLENIYVNKDKFSQTEIDILKLLEQGLPKEEIAKYFFLSINTIKWYAKDIYAKLGANSVTQAIFKARALGII